MKAIKIDVKKREVYEVEIDPRKIKTLYAHLDCDCFAVGAVLPEGDAILIDDCGLIINPDMMIGGFEIPIFTNSLLAGHGLITGVDAGGNTVPPQHTVESITPLILWRTVDQVREYASLLS